MSNAKTKKFIKIFNAARRLYGRNQKRLAGENWKHDWQTLIATIYSAQSRDELTIPVMENAFKQLPDLESWSGSSVKKIENLTKKINFYKTKSKHAKSTAQMLMKNFRGKVPDTIENLTVLPGVGRKTANLILTEIHKKDGICVDTHVHRISNVFGFVKTKTPYETELALQKVAPKKYWSGINRIFVLWGKEVRGRDKKKFLAKLG